jgi:disulfide bond formation protein DsbB
MVMTSLETARILAIAVPSALLAGAYGFEFIGGLHPCEMCYWQRWAHMAALAFGLGSFALRGLADKGRSFVWLAALFVFVSGAIGTWHAGVEAGIFAGVTQCAAIGASGSTQDVLTHIMSAPLVRCDEVPWSLFAVSMAGWNAIISIGLSMVIAWLSLRRPRIRT